MNALPLVVTDLCVAINDRPLLHNISFTVEAGERVGFIGGSGSGKTLTALAVAGLLPEGAEVSGSIVLGNQELVGLRERELAKIRGDLIGVVFQEPKTALNPLRKLGPQMTEALAHHYDLSRSERRESALRLADIVGLDEPDRIIAAYPHEVSGGQRQRAAIAASIAANPGFLFADEPTTALDVTVQQGILDLFHRISEGDETSLVFITHDLAVLSSIAERILVFADGKIVERGRTLTIVQSPEHAITRELIAAAQPTDPPRPSSSPRADQAGLL